MQTGQIVNQQYKLISLLGEGSFGDVWEVEDIKNPDTPKVLKILKIKEFQFKQYQNKIISLFEQEAEVLKNLNYQGIPKCYDYFTLKEKNLHNPLHCLILEKVDGENLKKWLEKYQKITDLTIAINWLKHLTEIIAVIHQEKLIHRDIKPENIILKSDGTLVLIDFGSVRQITATYLIKMGSNESGKKI